MTLTRREPAITAGSRRHALAALCATEIVSYGVIYYAFPVLAGQIAAGTGWSRAAVTAAYSAGNLAGAVTGIPVGRLLHRHGPRVIMTAAGILGTVSVAAIAVAPSYGAFLAAWLAAGIASTIFAPLTSALAAHLTWRGVYLTLAAVLAATVIPAHALALRPPWTPPRHNLNTPARARDRQVLASRAFLQLAAAATLCALAQYAALVNLVPLLESRGLSPRLAAWALGLGGAGQVAGRLCYRPLASRLGPRARTAVIIAAGAAATVLLGLLPGPVALLVTACVLAGAVRGVFTLTEATLITDYWGPERYAVLNGIFNAPIIAAGALAPAIGAGIAAATGSYPALFAILAVVAAAGAALAASAPPRPQRRNSLTAAARGADYGHGGWPCAEYPGREITGGRHFASKPGLLPGWRPRDCPAAGCRTGPGH